LSWVVSDVWGAGFFFVSGGKRCCGEGSGLLLLLLVVVVVVVELPLWLRRRSWVLGSAGLMLGVRMVIGACSWLVVNCAYLGLLDVDAHGGLAVSDGV